MFVDTGYMQTGRLDNVAFSILPYSLPYLMSSVKYTESGLQLCDQ